eukprot:2065684-Amphidinium_carterae.2
MQVVLGSGPQSKAPIKPNCGHNDSCNRRALFATADGLGPVIDSKHSSCGGSPSVEHCAWPWPAAAVCIPVCG